MGLLRMLCQFLITNSFSYLFSQLFCIVSENLRVVTVRNHQGSVAVCNCNSCFPPRFELMCSCWAEENEQRPAISTVSKTLSNILETEDDGIYANVGEVATSHNSKRNSVHLRQSPGADRGQTYSSSRLSNIQPQIQSQFHSLTSSFQF